MKSYTTDLFFAAFLKMKGYELQDFEVISKGRGKFKFKISDEDYKKMKLEFLKSDISRLKQIIEELKDLVW
jgi:hypothetical protein